VLTISASKPDTLIFYGKCSITIYTLEGFHPRYCGSPDTIKPNRCSVNIAQGRGGMGEQALSPPLSYQHLEYHINGKGIQQSHKIKKIHLSNQKYDGGTGNNSAEHQRIKRPCF
jgi:hypothetical protein